MNTKFYFNLQLFSEEDGGASPASGDITPPATSDVAGGDGGDFNQASTDTEPSPSASGEPQGGTAPVVKAGGLELVIDEKTGRKIVRQVSAPSEQNTEPAEPQGVAQQEASAGTQENAPAEPLVQARPNVVEYTPQEFTLAMQMNAVDEKRIPATYLPQYNQMKAQQQMLAQQQQQQASAQEQQQATAQTKEELETQAKSSMKEFYLKIDNASKTNAMRDAGFGSEEELEMAEFSNDPEDKEKLTVYKNALDWHKGQFMAEVQKRANERAAVREAQASLYNDIAVFTENVKQKEPNFDEINMMMQTHYKKLDYDVAAPIAQTLEAYKNGTITVEQCKILEKYYDLTRVAYYAQKNNLSTKPVAKPPVVERPGTGRSLPTKPDYSQLRGLSPRERQAWVKNYFGNK